MNDNKITCALCVCNFLFLSIKICGRRAFENDSCSIESHSPCVSIGIYRIRWLHQIIKHGARIVFYVELNISSLECMFEVCYSRWDNHVDVCVSISGHGVVKIFSRDGDFVIRICPACSFV